jgi:ketosteroid isomerase-like protein
MEGTYEGKGPYRRFLESLIETVDIDYENVGYLTDADRVVAIADVVGAGSTSGIPVQGRVAFVYYLRDGLIYRQEVHPDVETLLREVGISE